jgi:hypothetical protein
MAKKYTNKKKTIKRERGKDRKKSGKERKNKYTVRKEIIFLKTFASSGITG